MTQDATTASRFVSASELANIRRNDWHELCGSESLEAFTLAEGRFEVAQRSARNIARHFASKNRRDLSQLYLEDYIEDLCS